MARPLPHGKYGHIEVEMIFLIPLLALVAGILAGQWLESWFWPLGFIACGLASYLYILKKSADPIEALKMNRAHWVWIFLLFMGIGLTDANVNRPEKIPADAVGRYVVAQGVVKKYDSYAQEDRMVVDIDWMADSLGGIEEYDNLRLLLSADGFSTKRGDILMFPVKISRIADHGNRRGQGFAGIMERRGILYRTHVNAGAIKIVGFKPDILSVSNKIRDHIAILIEKSKLDRQSGEFLIAMMLGDRSLLSPELQDKFSCAGIAHILALSGTHVAIVLSILMLALFPLKGFGFHKMSYWVSVLLLWVFVFLTGCAPSTVRAALMATFVILARSTQRKNISGNALLVSVFIILLFDPTSVFDAGMQMSFLCVATILSFVEKLNPVGHHSHPILFAVVGAILVSIIATFGTWALSSYYFGIIPFLFLPANLIILPVLPAFMATAIIYIFLLSIGYDPGWIAWIIDNLYNFVTWIVEVVAGVENLAVSYRATLPVVVCWLSGLLLLGYAIRMKRKILPVGGAVCMFLLSIFIAPFLTEKTPDGIIFQRNYYDISLALYDGEKETIVTIPRKTVGSLTHKGIKILSVDCQADSTQIEEHLRDCHYVVLGDGADHERILSFQNIKNPRKVIVHSSVKNQKANKMIDAANKLGIDNLYIIRHSGPLLVEF